MIFIRMRIHLICVIESWKKNIHTMDYFHDSNETTTTVHELYILTKIQAVLSPSAIGGDTLDAGVHVDGLDTLASAQQLQNCIVALDMDITKKLKQHKLLMNKYAKCRKSMYVNLSKQSKVNNAAVKHNNSKKKQTKTDKMEDMGEMDELTGTPTTIAFTPSLMAAMEHTSTISASGVLKNQMDEVEELVITAEGNQSSSSLSTESLMELEAIKSEAIILQSSIVEDKRVLSVFKGKYREYMHCVNDIQRLQGYK